MTFSKLTRSRYGFNGIIFVGRRVFVARKPDPDGFELITVGCGATIASHAPLFIRSNRTFNWSRYLRTVAISTFVGRFNVPSI